MGSGRQGCKCPIMLTTGIMLQELQHFLLKYEREGERVCVCAS